MVITQHQNLDYLREAKMLNTLQARWPSPLPGLTSLPPNILALRIRKQMLYLISISLNQKAVHLNPSSLQPWSWARCNDRLGVDFISDLPPSDSNTCILIIVNRFSKACKLIPPKGLPTAFETAETLFQQVFRHFGIAEHIVSDWGPQFIHRVWHAFFQLLGASVRLTSGYHPQSKCQIERKTQETGRYLRSYCHNHQDSWRRFIPWAE